MPSFVESLFSYQDDEEFGVTIWWSKLPCGCHARVAAAGSPCWGRKSVLLSSPLNVNYVLDVGNQQYGSFMVFSD